MKSFLQAQIEVLLCALIICLSLAATRWYPQILGYSSANQQLLCAIDQGDQKGIDTALCAGASVTASDPDGSTALMHAAIAGNLRMTRELLARGAVLNAADRFGDDALLCAVRAQRKELVAFLLAAGADPHHQNMFGDNALRVARYWQANDIVEVLVKYT